MAKYAVSIKWTDSEDTGTDEFSDMSKALEFVAKEHALIGNNQDYPADVQMQQVVITLVDG